MTAPARENRAGAILPMKIFFKILFSPILIPWWLLKFTFRILAFPITIIWRILQKLVPEVTNLIDGPAAAIRDIFRRG